MLTPQEASELFEILRTLTREGLSIIFISHKLNEVLEIADRITVLRRGKLIETLPAAGATEESLATPDGRTRGPAPRREDGARRRASRCSGRGLRVRDDRGIEKVRGVSFEVRAGEIVGIAGVDGNGQTELIDALAGLRKVERPRRRSPATTSPTSRRASTSTAGSATSRRTASTAGSCSTSRSPRTSRCTTSASRRTPASAGSIPTQLVERARRLIKEFDVRGGGPQTQASALSGGNQQKVILAREIDRDPTRADRRPADPGPRRRRDRVRPPAAVEERDEGRGVLLVSLELDEVLSLADRILVIFEGEIVGEFPPTATEEELGLAMTGGGAEGAGGLSEHGVRSSRRTGPEPPRALAERYRLLQKAGGLVAPLLTVVLAFLISGVVVLLTTGSVGDTLETYRAIFRGSGLSWFFEVGSYHIGLPFTRRARLVPLEHRRVQSIAAANLQQTLILWVTLVLTGLAVAFAFRCGLFNIGGQGQYLAGSIAAVLVATELPQAVDLPGWLLILVTVARRACSPARSIAGIAGFLKGTVGAHEVITTIMLNWIVIWVGSYLFGIGGPFQTRRRTPALSLLGRHPGEGEAARFLGRPAAPGPPHRLLRRARALVVYSLTLNRTTLGYEVRAVGHNPEARATAASASRATTSWPWRSPASSPGSPAHSTSSAGSSGSTSPRSRARSRLHRHRRRAARPQHRRRRRARRAPLRGTPDGDRIAQPRSRVFPPDLASSLAIIIQGLIVLFVGADVIVLLALRRLRSGSTGARSA